jgi:predicted DNA binding CopG/RHH family protein
MRPLLRSISQNRNKFLLGLKVNGSSGNIPLGPFRLWCLNNLSVSVASEHVQELPMSDKVQRLSDAEQAENKRKLIAELEDATRRIRSVSEAEARALKQKMWREQVKRDGTEFEWGIVE